MQTFFDSEICEIWLRQLCNFLKKIKPKFSSGHIECSFDKPAGTFLAQNPESQEIFFSKMFLWT